jgi:hypothetical protein
MAMLRATVRVQGINGVNEEKMKSASFIVMRTIAFGIGLTFPFVSALWKIVILILFFIFRLIDIERERKPIGVTSLFFFGMLLAYVYRLF